jgi:hypothetical protein
VSRQERQQHQIATELARGHLTRVLVLAREHLNEFPEDLDVQLAAEFAARAIARGAPER